MHKACGSCGRDFEPKRSDAQYCSPKCRKAGARRRRGAQERGHVTPITSAPADPSPQYGETESRIREELASVGRLETWRGAAAISLARRVDQSTAVMGYAQLIKQLEATMDAAVAGAKKDPDQLDDIEERVGAKLIKLADRRR